MNSRQQDDGKHRMIQNPSNEIPNKHQHAQKHSNITAVAPNQHLNHAQTETKIIISRPTNNVTRITNFC
jgi:hypothetical protein